jgi:hypothetical protein
MRNIAGRVHVEKINATPLLEEYLSWRSAGILGLPSQGGVA